MRHGILLTRDIGHLIELVPPLVGDRYGLRLHVCSVGGVALLGGVVDNGHRVLLVDGVHDVEEVLPRRESPLRDLVREEPHELVDPFHVRPEILHRKLVVARHLHHLDGLQLHQLFLLREHHS